ncbi:MAG: hypothetical protein GWN87_10230, partial [Desulfuromonadales bacterium]|nr:hypothetical protein [Desulfuromonadales bacterium]
FDGAAAYGVIAHLWKLMGHVDISIAWTIRAKDLEPENPGHVHKLAERFADIGDFDTAMKLDPGGIAVLFHMR